MPTLRRDMSVGLRGDVMGSDDFDEDFLAVVLGVLVAKLREGAFDKEFARLNDADGVAELFDFAHDGGAEDDGFAVVAPLWDEAGDGRGGCDVEAIGGFIKDHHRGIVDEGTGDGGFLLHAGGELVAAAVTEAVHVETIEDVIDTLFQRRFVQTVEAAEVLNHFLRREAGGESGGGGEGTDICAGFFRVLNDVVAADEGRAGGWLRGWGE